MADHLSRGDLAAFCRARGELERFLRSRPSQTAASRDLEAGMKTVRGALNLAAGAPTGVLARSRPRLTPAEDVERPKSFFLTDRMACNVSTEAEQGILVKAHNGMKSKAYVELMATVRRYVCLGFESLRQHEPFAHLWGPRTRANFCLECCYPASKYPCLQCGAPSAVEADVLWLAARQAPLALLVHSNLAASPSIQAPSKAPDFPPDEEQDGWVCADPLSLEGASQPVQNICRRLLDARTSGVVEARVGTWVEVGPDDLLGALGALRPCALALASKQLAEHLHAKRECCRGVTFDLRWTDARAQAPLDVHAPREEVRPCRWCRQETVQRRVYGELSDGGLDVSWRCRGCSLDQRVQVVENSESLYTEDLVDVLSFFLATLSEKSPGPFLRVEFDAMELLDIGFTPLRAAALEERLEEELYDCRVLVVAWDASGLERDSVVLVHVYSSADRLREAFLVLRKGVGVEGLQEVGGAARCSSEFLDIVLPHRARYVGEIACEGDYPGAQRVRGVEFAMRQMAREMTDGNAASYGVSVLLSAARCAGGVAASVKAMGRQPPLRQLAKWGWLDGIVEACVAGEEEEPRDTASLALLGGAARVGCGGVDLYSEPLAGAPPGLQALRRHSPDDEDGASWPCDSRGLLSEQEKRAVQAFLAMEGIHGGQGPMSSKGDTRVYGKRRVRDGESSVSILNVAKRCRVRPTGATGLPLYML